MSRRPETLDDAKHLVGGILEKRKNERMKEFWDIMKTQNVEPERAAKCEQVLLKQLAMKDREAMTQLEGHYLKTVLNHSIDRDEVVKIAPLSQRFFGQLRTDSLRQAVATRSNSVASRYMNQVLENSMLLEKSTDTSTTNESVVLPSARPRPASVAGRTSTPDHLPRRPNTVLGEVRAMSPSSMSRPTSAMDSALSSMSYIFFGKLGKKSRVRKVAIPKLPTETVTYRRDRSMKIHESHKKDVPGPGEYTLDKPRVMRGIPVFSQVTRDTWGTEGGRSGPMHVGLAELDRALAAVEVQPKTQYFPKYPRFLDPSDPAMILRTDKADVVSDLPGPGAYTPTTVQTKKSKPKAVFSTADRYPPIKPTVGPGEYGVIEAHESLRAMSAHHKFSPSVRGKIRTMKTTDLEEGLSPGPAHYSPIFTPILKTARKPKIGGRAGTRFPPPVEEAPPVGYYFKDVDDT